MNHFDDFPAFVHAAVGASPVRQFGLMAVGALRKPGRTQMVVGAPVGGASV